MARVLIVGGGCRGRTLATELIQAGHALRMTTRAEEGRPAIEALGAECWIGTPDLLQTLRGALDGVTVACWMLGTARGERTTLEALHTTRLELFLTQAIDTTVRGLVYEAGGDSGPPEARAHAEEIVRLVTERNEIPLAWLRSDPGRTAEWVAEARAAVDGFLAAR